MLLFIQLKLTLLIWKATDKGQRFKVSLFIFPGAHIFTDRKPQLGHRSFLKRGFLKPRCHLQCLVCKKGCIKNMGVYTSIKLTTSTSLQTNRTSYYIISYLTHKYHLCDALFSKTIMPHDELAALGKQRAQAAPSGSKRKLRELYRLSSDVMINRNMYADTSEY